MSDPIIVIPREEYDFLNKLRDACASYAVDAGFRAQMFEGLTEEQKNGRLGRLLKAAVFTANQHGEASEFWDAFRANKLDSPCDKAEKMQALGLPPISSGAEEIADEIIRCLDKAEIHNIDIAEAVFVKMVYNRSRPKLHGGKKA